MVQCRHEVPMKMRVLALTFALMSAGCCGPDQTPSTAPPPEPPGRFQNTYTQYINGARCYVVLDTVTGVEFLNVYRTDHFFPLRKVQVDVEDP